MTMTKKHFIAIAAILNGELRDFGFSESQSGAIHSIAHELADYFQTINPNFDKERFITACLKPDEG